MASRTASAGAFVAGVTTVAQLNNLPGGWIGYAEITTDSSSFTALTDITGMSQAVTVNTNRKIRITVSCSCSLTVAQPVNFYIREGSTQLRGIQRAWGTDTTVDHLHLSVVLNPTSGSHTYKFSASRGGASGSVTILANTDNPASILIEDIGPSS